jgi:hypothetical protein
MPEGALPPTWSYSAALRPEDKLAYELAWSIDSHHGDGPLAIVRNVALLDGMSKEVAADIYNKLSSSTSFIILLKVCGPFPGKKHITWSTDVRGGRQTVRRSMRTPCLENDLAKLGIEQQSGSADEMAFCLRIHYFFHGLDVKTRALTEAVEMTV